MGAFRKRTVNDVLGELKDIQFSLDRIPCDNMDSVNAAWLNKAKNKVMDLIADGQRRQDELLKERFEGAAGPDS